MREFIEKTPLDAWIKQQRTSEKKIAFVPTMGNLHEGHLRLVDEAKASSDVVVVSIFVNPMQFGPSEDFQVYPRTLESDRQKLWDRGVDALFTPMAEFLYKRDLVDHAFVSVPKLSEDLCGKFRPGHFNGVCTVVLKLLNLVRPDVLVMGEKDLQQIRIIEQMICDLNLSVVLKGVAIVRESDGLALSSRNQYLALEERQLAPTLFQTLHEMKKTIQSGEKNYAALCEKAALFLKNKGFNPDYIEVRRAQDLKIPSSAEDKALVVLAAAYLGKTRLIDNLFI